MSIAGPIDKIPQKSSSIRQAEVLMEYAETRGKERVQQLDSQIERASAATSAVEASIKGALVNKTG